jgi:site-specific DNA-methyltransferase (adenine-specific)
MATPFNTLFYGDNLEVLREHIADEAVDLIYLDPPFNSKRDYNILFKESSGEAPASQIKAFGDTWQYSEETERARAEISGIALQYGCPKLPLVLDGFIDVLGRNDVTAYLVMMAIRLLELKRVLKPTGSFYIHCDETASHYLKVLLDTVFGARGYRNELIWKRTSAHNDAGRYGRVHDVVLYYTKSDKFTWNQIYEPFADEYVEQYYRYKDANGRRFMSGDLGAAGLTGGGYEYEWNGVTRIWRCPQSTMEKLETEGKIFYTRNGIPRLKRYLDEAKGLPASDVWTDLESLRSWHGERLGYPTQKPEALLERIIQASSNEGDVVLDPFCGCGTTISVAQKLNRKWLGIDVTYLAIALIESRLKGQYDLKPKTDYHVVGVPADLASALDLFRRDPYQFQFWALTLIPAFPAGGEKKKGADKGIDGLVTFVDGAHRKTQTVIVQVKGGHVTVNQIRDLRGTLEREKAAMGFFVCLEAPTGPMKIEAAGAGVYSSELWGRTFPRLQIRTVEELLSGHGFEYPQHAAATWKQAAKAATPSTQQAMELD